MDKASLQRRSTLQSGLALIGGFPFLLGLSTTSTARVPLAWNNILLHTIRMNKPPIPVTARALAILHTCMYDAWSAYDAMAISTSLGTRLRRPLSEHTLYHKEEAISYAAYRALSDLFPDQEPRYRATMGQLGYTILSKAENTITPAGIGNLVAHHVLDFRHQDGSNQLGTLHPGAYSDYTGYQAVNTPDVINDPNHWQPLRVTYDPYTLRSQSFTTPHWGQVKPFALTSGSLFRPTVAPATIHTDLYTRQAHQILELGANLTDRQKVIADYWKNGPASEQPTGHWFLIAHYLIRRDMYDLDKAIKLFFILGNTLLDASIACWDTKRAYNAERPITAIRFLYPGRNVLAWGGPTRGTMLIDGADWQPYAATPSSPEYCSAHSAFSMASATILALFSRSDYFGGSYKQEAGTSSTEPGVVPAHTVTLAWKTFSEAALQAGMSRRYGGIHFEQGDVTGRYMGQAIANLVWKQANRYINGTLAFSGK